MAAGYREIHYVAASIAVNLCIDKLRRRTFQPIEAAEDVVDASSDPARDADRAELRRAVRAALDSLPGKQKAAVVLCLYEGFTGKEAANILGISVLAVQSLLVRARGTLRVSLAELLRWRGSMTGLPPDDQDDILARLLAVDALQPDALRLQRVRRSIVLAAAGRPRRWWSAYIQPEPALVFATALLGLALGASLPTHIDDDSGVSSVFDTQVPGSIDGGLS